ncbi:hypothetical protein AAULR_22269 [Lacticaseibacillus rhamnosus MTCC 5462]|nr:hypothetical protein AAULR_22269 [Lacticaseibacillus rhamnosus MTCC 5462]
MTASIPIGIGSTVGAALFYAWKNQSRAVRLLAR